MRQLFSTLGGLFIIYKFQSPNRTLTVLPTACHVALTDYLSGCPSFPVYPAVK